MLSCTWEAGLPTMQSIPFTEHANFTSACAACAQQHQPQNTTANKASQSLTSAQAFVTEDLGEKISRDSISTAPACTAQLHTEASADAMRGSDVPALVSSSSSARRTDQHAQPSPTRPGNAGPSSEQPAEVPAVAQREGRVNGELMHTIKHNAAPQLTSAAALHEPQGQDWHDRICSDSTAQLLEQGHIGTVATSNRSLSNASQGCGTATNSSRQSQPANTQATSGDLLVFEDRYKAICAWALVTASSTKLLQCLQLL